MTELSTFSKEDTLVLERLKKELPLEVYSAVIEWAKDEYNEIGGGFIVKSYPNGKYQDEGRMGYWSVLHGHFIDQFVGLSGDDYSGTLTLQLGSHFYLQAFFGA